MRNLDEYRYENQLEKQKASREEALLAGQRAVYGMSKLEKESSKSTTGCFGVFGLLITLGCLFWMTSMFTAQSRLVQAGTMTEGVVDMIATSRYFTSATYHFEIDGKKYSRMTDHYIGGIAPGGTVPVRYLPSDPEQSEIVGQENHLPSYLFAFGGIMIAGMGTAAAFVQWRKLFEPEAPLFSSDSEPEQGPEWATKPYQNTAISSQNLPPADAMPLNDLPGDRQ